VGCPSSWQAWLGAHQLASAKALIAADPHLAAAVEASVGDPPQVARSVWRRLIIGTPEASAEIAGLMQLHRTATGEELSIDWAPTSAADRALAVTAVAVVRTREADALSSGHAVRARLSSRVDLGQALSEVNAIRQVDDWALASAGTPIDAATSSAMVRATVDVVTEALGGATASSPEWRKALDLLNLAPDASVAKVEAAVSRLLSSNPVMAASLGASDPTTPERASPSSRAP